MIYFVAILAGADGVRSIFKISNICTCKQEAYTGTSLVADQVKTHTPIHPQGVGSGQLVLGLGIGSECWVCVNELAMDACWVCKLASELHSIDVPVYPPFQPVRISDFISNSR